MYVPICITHKKIEVIKESLRMRLYTDSSNIEVLFSNKMSLWPHTHVHWSAKNVNEIAHYLSYV